MYLKRFVSCKDKINVFIVAICYVFVVFIHLFQAIWPVLFKLNPEML